LAKLFLQEDVESNLVRVPNTRPEKARIRRLTMTRVAARRGGGTAADPQAGHNDAPPQKSAK